MISVVIPAYNEEAAVSEVVASLRSTLQEAGEEFEILVVNDGSDDGTAEAASTAGAVVIHHPQNAGYGRALKNGILAANHDTIVICDADGSYPVEQVPELLARYREGFDMVVGARRGFRDSLFKAPLRLLLKWLVEYTAGRRVPDVNSGLRVFSKSAVTPHFPRLSDSFSFTTSVTLAYLMSRRFVCHLPVPYRRRQGRSKVRLMRDSLRTLQYIVQAILYHNPLKLFLLLGALCVLLAAAGFAAAAAFGLPGGILLGAGGLMTAIVVFCCGLLADLLKQILEKG